MAVNDKDPYGIINNIGITYESDLNDPTLYSKSIFNSSSFTDEPAPVVYSYVNGQITYKYNGSPAEYKLQGSPLTGKYDSVVVYPQGYGSSGQKLYNSPSYYDYSYVNIPADKYIYSPYMAQVVTDAFKGKSTEYSLSNDLPIEVQLEYVPETK